MNPLDQLALDAQRGDEAALCRLLEEFTPWARGLARRLAPRDADGQGELVSLARIAAWRSLKAWFAARGPWEAYARVSASRAMSQAAFRLATPVGGGRRQQRAVARGQASAEILAWEDERPAAAWGSLADEDGALTRVALSDLLKHISAGERELLELRYLKGLSVREAAVRLGRTRATLHRLERAAIARLQHRVGVVDGDGVVAAATPYAAWASAPAGQP